MPDKAKRAIISRLRDGLRFLGFLATFFFVLSLPLLLVATNVRLVANDLRLYEYGFNKFDVSAQTEIEGQDLLQIARGLIAYFNSGEEYFQTRVRIAEVERDLFNEKEVKHFKDVKGLLQLLYRVQEVTLAYAIGYLALSYVLWRGAFLRRLAKATFWGSGVTLALLLFLGLGSLLDFNRLFYWFHLLGFRNLLWVAGPGDIMARLFPQGFFLDATLFIAGATIAEAIAIGGIAWGYLLLTREKG